MLHSKFVEKRLRFSMVFDSPYMTNLRELSPWSSCQLQQFRCMNLHVMHSYYVRAYHTSMHIRVPTKRPISNGDDTKCILDWIPYTMYSHCTVDISYIHYDVASRNLTLSRYTGESNQRWAYKTSFCNGILCSAVLIRIGAWVYLVLPCDKRFQSEI